MSQYGPRTTMAVALAASTTGGSAAAFEVTFQPNSNRWVVTREKFEIAPAGKVFAPGNLRATSDQPAYKRLFEHWVDNRYQLRYTGGMVPDVYHILIKNKGVFSNVASAAAKAKLRLLYECAPIALLIEAAGGASVVGPAPGAAPGEAPCSVLDVEIDNLDKRIGLCLGGTEEVAQDVDQAAGLGRVEALDKLWRESNGAVYPSSTGLQMAVAADNIATLEWAHSRGLGGFERLMDVAAWRGRLSVLKWLLANRVERCTTNAVNWAARSGHLKVLRWLRDNLGFHECTSEGLEAAAIAGHVHVVSWLLRNSRVLLQRRRSWAQHQTGMPTSWSCCCLHAGKKRRNLVGPLLWPSAGGTVNASGFSKRRVGPSNKLSPMITKVGLEDRQRKIAPVTARKRFPGPTVERKHGCDFLKTTSSCGVVGARSRAPVDGSQEGGVGVVGGPEGFYLEGWPWFSEGASGVVADGERCFDASGALEGFIGAEQEFAVGDKKSRVRDVWSPVSGGAGALEARLNLGALDTESQEPGEEEEEEGPSGCHMGYQGEDLESFLLCRGWGNFPERMTPRSSEGVPEDKLADPSPSSPEYVSPGFVGEPGESAAADQLFLRQGLSIPQRRSSLAGTPPNRSLKTRFTPLSPALTQETALSLHSGVFGGLVG
eukprot:g17722.t2